MPRSRANSADPDARRSSPASSASDDERSDHGDSGNSDDEVDNLSQNNSSASSDDGGSEISQRSPTNQDSHDNEDAKSADGQSAHSGSAEAPEMVNEGLMVEEKAGYLTQGDLVIVHGIVETPWVSDKVSDSTTRGATIWLSQYAGYTGWQYLSYFYPLKTTDTSMSALWYRDGIEKEAVKLLDGLVAWRRDLSNEFGEEKVRSRPINFVAHDVGGTIVKKALTIACLNPDKYGSIPYCTTTLVFLSCPHRGTASELREPLAKLLYMPDDTWRLDVESYAKHLAETVEQTNGEFYDTNMLTRAGVINVYTQDDPELPSLFRFDHVTFDVPWEDNIPCQIRHLQLVDGGYLGDEPHDNNYALLIRDQKDTFPIRAALFEDVDFHKILLSQAPPCLPLQPAHYDWDPHKIDKWFVGHETCQEWLEFRGIGVLHAHGNTGIAIKSRRIRVGLEIDQPSMNVMYFEFRRHDVRFNTIESLLLTFVTHMITRISRRISKDYMAMMPLFEHSEGLSRTDLMRLFRSLLLWQYTPPMVFMIACLDECDSNRDSLLRLINSLQESTEARHSFIITSLPEESLITRLQGSFTINLEDFDTSTETVWFNTFEETYEAKLKALTDTHPVYKRFMPHIREILAACGSDVRLGCLIVDWLSREDKRGSRDTISKAEETLSSLEAATPSAALETIITSFGQHIHRARLYLDWVGVACRPLSLREIGTAVDFTESSDPATLEFLDFDYIRGEIEVLDGVLQLTDNTVDFWHPYFAQRSHCNAGELERAHGLVAGVCLDYLRVPSILESAQEFCDRFTELDSICPFPPKDTLLAYAVQYWAHHYDKAGDHKPQEKAMSLFHDAKARNTWWRVLNLLVGPLGRSTVSYLSALPVMAATGLADLLESQLSLESENDTFEDDANLAFLEAARHGYADAVTMLSDRIRQPKEVLLQALEHTASCESLDAFNVVLRLASNPDVEFEPSPSLIRRTVWLGWTEAAKTLFDMLAARGMQPQFDALHLAVGQEDQALVELVIRWTNDVNSRDEWGQTALHLAATAGNPAIISLLVAHGAAVDALLDVYDVASPSPLRLAAGSGNHLAVDALLSQSLPETDPNEGSDGRGKQSLVWSDEANQLVGPHEGHPLAYAAAVGHSKCLEAFIKHGAGAGLSARVRGCTALWWAVHKGHDTMARMLLEAGAEPDDNNPDEETDGQLLGIVIERNKIDLLDLLLEYNADVNQKLTWRQTTSTPLALAARLGHLEIVERLLAKGAEPSPAVKDALTPLYQSVLGGHSEILKLLIEKGADIHQPAANGNWTALHAAAGAAPEFAEILLDMGINMNHLSDAGTCLYIASKNNFIGVVELLLKKGAELDIATISTSEVTSEFEIGLTPLCAAAYNNNIEVVKMLVEAGADVNWMVKDKETGNDRILPLMLSMEGPSDANNARAIEVLIDGKADVGKTVDGKTVLHCLHESTQLSDVRALVAAGADVNAVDKEQNTPLIVALGLDRNDIASFLISVGADVNYYSPRHGTPLHITCKRANWEIFSDLIRWHASISRADEAGYGSTLLGALAESNKLWENTEPIARHLIEKAKVDPNAKCKNQPYYPLCRVEWESSPALGDYLIEHGANLDPEDEAWGLRPVHFAAWWSLSRYKELLDKGAKDRLPRNKVGMSPWHYAAAGGELKENIEETFGDARTAIRDEDVDGWNALLWTARSFYTADTEELLHKGGRDLIWHKGYVYGERLWSPLKVARYMDTMDATCAILTPRDDERKRQMEDGKEEEWEDDAHETRVAARKDQDCFMCLSTIYGYVYHCSICDTDLCFKCVRSKELFDPGHEYAATGYEFFDEANNTDRDGTASDVEKTSAVDEASSVVGSDDESNESDEHSVSDQDESSADSADDDDD